MDAFSFGHSAGGWYPFRMDRDKRNSRTPQAFRRVWAGCLAWIAGGACLLFAQDDAVNFKVPRVNEAGVMESVMTGERAKIVPGKPMRVEILKILFFEDDGETVNLTVTSPACRYDPRERLAVSEHPVEIQGQTFHVQGVGYEYRMEEEKMEIHNKVRVRFWDLDRKRVKDGEEAEAEVPGSTTENRTPRGGRPGTILKPSTSADHA